MENYSVKSFDRSHAELLPRYIVQLIIKIDLSTRPGLRLALIALLEEESDTVQVAEQLLERFYTAMTLKT